MNTKEVFELVAGGLMIIGLALMLNFLSWIFY